MKGKTTLLALLGMSSSFTVILALMVALSYDPPSRPHRNLAKSRPAGDPPRTTAEPPRRPGRTSADGGLFGTRMGVDAAPAGSDSTTAAARTAPTPLQPPSGLSRPRRDEAWLERQREFELILQEIRRERVGLQKQLSMLERDRSRMVNELARELSGSKPGLAAAELVGLDDETAALVLKKMSTDPRGEVLDLLDPKRAQRLRGRIARL